MPIAPFEAPAVFAILPSREQLIQATSGAWVSRFIDLSRRDNLLFYRPTPSGTIDLPGTHALLPDLLAGKALSAEALVSDLEGRTGRVLSLAKKALENSEEKGLQMLYVAVGFARWKADDGGRDVRAPVFLVSLQVKRKGRDVSMLDLQIAGEAEVNPVLLHVLADQFNVHVDEDQLLSIVQSARSRKHEARSLRRNQFFRPRSNRSHCTGTKQDGSRSSRPIVRGHQ